MLKTVLKTLLLTPSNDEYLGNRRGVGLGVFFGFFIGLAGYAVTGAGWWFLAPFIGFTLAWRLVFGRWPFSRINRN